MISRQQLHQIILNSPFINYLDIDSDELCEGECTLWNETTTFLLDYSGELNPVDFTILLPEINKHLNWINHNRALICQQAIEQSQVQLNLNNKIAAQLAQSNQANIKGQIFTAPLSTQDWQQALHIEFICFYIDEKQLFCDFSLSSTPDYLFGKSIDIERTHDGITITDINEHC